MKGIYKISVPYIVWMLVTVNASNPLAYKGQLPELPVIKQFLQQYVHPYLRSLQSYEAPVFRTNTESKMSPFIRERLREWKPYLQDDDAQDEPKTDLDSDDRLTLEGEDETTIVEFPLEIKNNLRNVNDTSESYKAIQRYKLLRNKIKTVLDTEAVSHKTKKLVTNALDDMIAHMIGNQCNWKKGFLKSRQGSQLKNRVDPLVMARTWNNEWQKLKLQYLKTVRSQKEDANPLFRQFQHLISNITNDIKLLSKDYRIECQLIVDNDWKQNKTYNDDFDQTKTVTDKIALRHKHKFKKLKAKDSTCDNFKLCSDELAVHLNDFYVNLNESVVSTLNNYAAMYSRDVVDDDEKDIAVSLVLEISKIVQNIVKTSFKKHTKKFKPAKDKNKGSNIKALKEYIERTIKSTRKRAKKVLELNLNPLKTRLTETIVKDIIVNLDVELGNLERDICGRICTIFEMCNGRYIPRLSRKQGGKLIGDKNSVYVKVHLTLGDNLNDTLNVGTKFRRNNPMEVQQQNTVHNRFMRYTKTTIVSINVTRTTLSNTTRTTLSDTVTDNTRDTSPSLKVNEKDSNLI